MFYYLFLATTLNYLKLNKLKILVFMLDWHKFSFKFQGCSLFFLLTDKKKYEKIKNIPSVY